MTKANRLFIELNRKFWRGRLPKHRVICRANMPEDGFGYYYTATKTIWLWAGLGEEALRCVLLHEMCHIGTGAQGYSHGPRFLRKLQRLVRLGEPPKLLKDMEECDSTALERLIAKQEAATEEPVPPLPPLRVDLRSQLVSRPI